MRDFWNTALLITSSIFSVFVCPVTQAHINICFLCRPIVVQRSEGVGGELAGVRRVAANGGAESGRVGGGDRHKATGG